MLRRNICEERTGELDSIFARLSKINDRNFLKSITDFLEEHLPTDEDFSSFFQKHQFKGKNKERAKYVLEQIEYSSESNQAKNMKPA